MSKRNPSLDDADNLRAIADDTYDWETWFGPDGRALWTNPAVERMTGYTVAACLGMPDYPLQLLHADDRSRIEEVLCGACEGSTGNDLEFRLLRDDGAERWVAMSWQSTFNRRGERLGFRTSVRDIHDRKGLELQLREALKAAHAAERVKDEFLAMMSHELRTPLQCIQGHTELLFELSPTVEQRRRLDVVRDQTELLTGLLENILELSALQAGAPILEFYAVSFGQLVSDVCESLRPRAQSAGLSLSVERSPNDSQRIRTDARALQQVVANLVHNAIKFTNQGGVRVRTSVTDGAGDSLCVAVEVQDTGAGVPPELHQRIFEPFVQARPLSAVGGSGLGLSIARRLCEALGAELTLVSSTDPSVDLDNRAKPGATFRVSLTAPRADVVDRVWSERTPQAEPVETAFAQRHPVRVLLVEDSEPARELLSELLEHHGYAIDVATTGHEALAQLATNNYGLLLLDLHLPGLDGASVARKMENRRLPDGRSPKVVALTAGLVGHTRAQLLADGFDAVLLKPIGIAGLQRVLRWAAGHGAMPTSKTDGRPELGSLRPEVLSELDIATPGGDSLLRRTAARIHAQLPGHHSALRDAVAAQDRQALARACHRIRGECLLIGATACVEAATLVERSIADAADVAGNGWEARAELIAELDAQLNALEPVLARLGDTDRLH